MAYSAQAPANLITMAFDAYNAPIQSNILKADLQLKQQEVQSNALALQNQMGFQQDMTNIWGSGGLSSANFADPSDPQVQQKLLATATDAFAKGMPQIGQQMISGMSMLAYRNAETQKFGAQTQAKVFDTVGSALGSVHDQASEDAAVALIRAQGIDPTRYGITTNYIADAPKLPQLAQAAMSRSQQLLAQYRDESFAERQSQDAIGNKYKALGYDMQTKRLAMEQARVDLATHAENRKQVESDRVDARAQEGLSIKKLEAEDRSYANASRVQPLEAQAAEGIFASDDRTSKLPAPLQKSLALLAARRAKMAISQQMRDSGDVEYEPEDFETALSQQIGAMQREGMFQMGDGGTLGDPTYHFPGGKPGAAPTPATAPKAEADKMAKMQADSKVQAILHNKKLSDEEKTKQIMALGYKQ